MANVSRLLDEYAADNRHPVNELLHQICVPAIAVSLIGLLWSLPVPGALREVSAFLNWGTAALLAILIYYFSQSWSLAAGMLVAAAVTVVLVSGLDRLPGPLWLASGAVFVVAWIGQFIGHGFEGKRPSFFRDLRFLLIGPLWLLAGLYRRLGIRI